MKQLDKKVKNEVNNIGRKIRKDHKLTNDFNFDDKEIENLFDYFLLDELKAKCRLRWKIRR